MKRSLIVITILASALSALGQTAFNANLDALRNSVVFLYGLNAQGQSEPVGTGFLLSVPLKSDHNRSYYFLVTARHIADPAWAHCPNTIVTLTARLNKKNYDPNKDDIGTIDYPITPIMPGITWIVPDDPDVDIAYTLVNPNKFTEPVANQPISFRELPTEDEVKQLNSGAQIASAGLLVGATGKKRNYPIFKFGYIASIPDEKIDVSCCVGCATVPRKTWMIAASLVPGNSGSPIIYVPAGFQGISVGNQRAFLLGVQSTSFLGSDVAGMAPISFLYNSIVKQNIPDGDLTLGAPTQPAIPPQPTSAQPQINVPPGKLPH